MKIIFTKSDLKCTEKAVESQLIEIFKDCEKISIMDIFDNLHFNDFLFFLLTECDLTDTEAQNLGYEMSNRILNDEHIFKHTDKSKSSFEILINFRKNTINKEFVITFLGEMRSSRPESLAMWWLIESYMKDESVWRKNDTFITKCIYHNLSMLSKLTVQTKELVKDYIIENFIKS